MKRLRIRAPGKVNLGLWVLGRRADGYHELWTLMETISLADQISLTARESTGIGLTVSGRSAPTGEDNLVVRAARLLKERCGSREGVEIHLHKVIPAGAGLGGGSSDAGATLVGLSRLWGLGLSGQDLLRLGAEIGSDVSFFVAAQLADGCLTAVCSGRGEQVEPVEAGGGRWYVLVLPGQGVSTAEVYASLDAASDLTSVPGDAKKTKEALQQGDIDGLRKWCHNDLQEAALTLSPGCLGAHEAMQEAGLPQAMVSGSGSAVYCICRSREEAEDYAARLRKHQARPGFEVVVVPSGPGPA